MSIATATKNGVSTITFSRRNDSETVPKGVVVIKAVTTPKIGPEEGKLVVTVEVTRVYPPYSHPGPAVATKVFQVSNDQSLRRGMYFRASWTKVDPVIGLTNLKLLEEVRTTP